MSNLKATDLRIGNLLNNINENIKYYKVIEVELEIPFIPKQ